ncbi:MAG: hypothetical protein U5L95_03170 [Candidatus Saccharibacteria bacterium]|nr:hypothetical protein [Candidatus Saccharibacteria bacterium]
MRSLRTLWPHKVELLLYGIIAAMIMTLGNFDFFARQLGLIDHTTNAVITDVISGYINDGVRFIDGFSVTAVSSVFLFWSFVGILTLSVIHTVSETYHEVSQDVEVATKFYHPRHFSTKKFWVGVIKQAVLNSGLYVIVLFFVFFVSVVMSPVAVSALHEVVSNLSVASIGIFVGAAFALWLSLVILGVGIRLILLRKHFQV